MKNTEYCIFNQEPRQIINSQLDSDKNLFRTEAEIANFRYKPKYRKFLKKISTKKIKSNQILDKWFYQIFTKNKILNEKVYDEDFKNSLIDNLLLNDKEINLKIQSILNQRLSEIKNEFLFSIYPANDNKYYKKIILLNKFLQRSDSEINQLRIIQENYLIYKELSNKYKVTIFDPYDNFIKKLISNHRISVENSKIIKDRNQRLENINKRIEYITNINDGIVLDIINQRLDLMAIINIKNEYEKIVKKLPKKYIDNDLKKLEIFEKETNKFRNNHISTNSKGEFENNLELARNKIIEIDSILLKIFKMTNQQKNQLISQVNEYQELCKEKISLES